MFWLNLIITAITIYFAKEEYERGRIGFAMFWSVLVGWDLHTLLGVL